MEILDLINFRVMIFDNSSVIILQLKLSTGKLSTPLAKYQQNPMDSSHFHRISRDAPHIPLPFRGAKGVQNGAGNGTKMVSKKGSETKPFLSSETVKNAGFPLCFRSKWTPEGGPKWSKNGARNGPGIVPKSCPKWSGNGEMLGFIGVGNFRKFPSKDFQLKSWARDFRKVPEVF